MATPLADLPEDVLLQILNWLSPISVVVIGSTCKHLFDLSNLREVWTPRLREICATRNIDLSIYDIQSMSSTEVRDVVLRPFHCMSALRKAREPAESLTDLRKSMAPFQVLRPSSPSESMLMEALRRATWAPYMDSTGRFLVVTLKGGNESTFFELWDLGTSPKFEAKLLWSPAKNTAHHKFAFESWVRGVFVHGVDGVLEVVVVVFVVPYHGEYESEAASRLELYRFQARPQREKDHLKQLLTLQLTPSQGWGLPVVAAQGDLLLCYHRASAPLICVWNFVHNTIVAWDAPDRHRRSQVFFYRQTPYFLSTGNGKLYQYQLQPADHFTPVPSTTADFLTSLDKPTHEPESALNYFHDLHPDYHEPPPPDGNPFDRRNAQCRWHSTGTSTCRSMHFVGILTRHTHGPDLCNALVVYWSLYSDNDPDRQYQLFLKVAFDGADGFTFFEDDILLWRGIEDGTSLEYTIIHNFPDREGEFGITHAEWKTMRKPGAQSEPDYHLRKDRPNDSDALDALEAHLFRIEDFVFQQLGPKQSALAWLSK